MPGKEISLTKITESIGDVDQVYRLAKGKLPLQEPQLEGQYVEALKGYFDYTRKALTDSDIVSLMKRRGIDKSVYGSPPYAVWRNFIHAITEKTSNDPNLVCLATEPTPRLVYDAEHYLFLIGKKSEYIQELTAKWRNGVIKKYVSPEGYNDWEFGQQIQAIGQGHRIYLYGYRTMGAGDLWLPGMLPKFVRGTGDTFAELKKAGEQEIAEKYNGVQELDKIQAITGAFTQANKILDRVFNPSEEAQTSGNRERRPRGFQ